MSIPLSTPVDRVHFHPSISHCIFMCIVGSENMLLFSFKNELQNCTYMHVLLFSISPPFSVNEMPMDHVSKSSETGRPAFLMSCVYFSSQLASTIIAKSRHFNLFFYFEKLCWNPDAHKTKGKNDLWCRNTLEIDIFHNPVECSMCTRNDRDARLAKCCLLLREIEYIAPSYSSFFYVYLGYLAP